MMPRLIRCHHAYCRATVDITDNWAAVRDCGHIICDHCVTCVTCETAA